MRHAPAESALVRAIDPDWWVTAEIRLLREIEHGTRVLAWMRTRDGQKGRNYPVRVPLTAAEREDVAGIRPDVMPTSEMNTWLGGAFADLNSGGGGGRG